MPRYEVPGAAAAGAIYPGGAPAYYFMNYTGAPGYVIHLSGGGWRFSGGADTDSSDTTAGEGGIDAVTSMTEDGIGMGHLGDSGLGGDGGGTCYGHCDGILSNDAAVNPLFHSWNKIWIPISGTSFTGDVWDSSKGATRVVWPLCGKGFLLVHACARRCA